MFCDKQHLTYQFGISKAIANEKSSVEYCLSDPDLSPTLKEHLKFKPVHFFAWLNNKGEIDAQRGYKNPGPLAYAHLTADWVCISTFKSAWFVTTNKWGLKERKSGKCKENLYSILGCFTDLDSPLPVDEETIRQRCRAYNLPEPTYIIETSPNHYHVVWIFERSLIINHRSLLQFWGLVQDAIYELFKDLGADSNAKDACRYLRNPNKPNAVNYKYPDKPTIKTVHRGGKTSLSNLYYSLRDAGLIEQKEKTLAQATGWLERNRAKGRVARLKLRTFLKQHPDWTGTYSQLFAQLGICERTGYLITAQLKAKASGELKTENIRVGRTWVTRFTFDTANSSKPCTPRGDISLYFQALGGFNSTGIGEHYRNNAVFLLGLWLKVLGRGNWGADDVQGMLEPGFLRSFSQGSHLFDRAEFGKTISNAFKGRYTHCHSYRSDRFQKVLAGLGLSVSQPLSLQCETETKTRTGNGNGNGNDPDPDRDRDRDSHFHLDLESEFIHERVKSLRRSGHSDSEIRTLVAAYVKSKSKKQAWLKKWLL